MRVVRVVVVVSGNVVVGKGGSTRWRLVNVVFAVVGVLGLRSRVGTSGRMGPHQWTILFAFVARRECGFRAKFGWRVIDASGGEKLHD